MDKRDKSKKHRYGENYTNVETADDKPQYDDNVPKFDKNEYEKKRRRYRKLVEDEIRKYWDGQRERYHYTPWLIIRYASGDFGLRPIPSGQPYWHSPDIWIESSDPNGKGVAGEENFVHARIFNLGMADAVPVKVDFYWANPALGLGEANMNHIGTEWVEVRSQSLQEVRCNTPWVPVHVNNGHECLMVNCTNAILDPITSPFEPTNDRHVGQRNVTVLPAHAGDTLPFRLELNNYLPMTTKTIVFARAAHITVNKALHKQLNNHDLTNAILFFNRSIPNAAEMNTIYRRGTSEFRNAQSAARLSRTGKIQTIHDQFNKVLKLGGLVPSIVGEISESRRQFLSNKAPLTLANHLIARSKLAVNGCRRGTDLFKFQEIKMQTMESRQLDVELGIPAGAKHGDHIAFYFEQWMDDIALGGYTIIVQVHGDTHNQCK